MTTGDPFTRGTWGLGSISWAVGSSGGVLPVPIITGPAETTDVTPDVTGTARPNATVEITVDGE